MTPKIFKNALFVSKNDKCVRKNDPNVNIELKNAKFIKNHKNLLSEISGILPPYVSPCPLRFVYSGIFGILATPLRFAMPPTFRVFRKFLGLGYPPYVSPCPLRFAIPPKTQTQILNFHSKIVIFTEKSHRN